MARTADPTDIPRRLSEAGRALFQQQGYNATGIQQIADQAGVPKGSFYNHFDSKEAFAAHILRNYGQWVDAAWTASLSDAPRAPVAAIHHLLDQFIEHHRQSGCQGCLVGNFAAEVVDASQTCREVVGDVLGHWRDRLAVLIEQGQQAGQIRGDLSAQALSTFFWDAWEGAVLRSKIERSVQALHDARRLMLETFFAPTS